MGNWQLRFEPKQIHELVRRYEQQLAERGQRDEESHVIEIGLRARQAGQFCKDDFLRVCKWKTTRSQSRCRKNSSEEVSEITRIALSTTIERLRIDILRCLHGVEWPTASVLLHLAHSDRYPILDVRALWSWGFDKTPSYSFRFWEQYFQKCRQLAVEQGVDMRKLDRALWQYSKEHQGPLD